MSRMINIPFLHKSIIKAAYTSFFLLPLFACSGDNNPQPFQNQPEVDISKINPDESINGHLSGNFTFANAPASTIEFNFNQTLKKWESMAVSIFDIQKNYFDFYLSRDCTITGYFWPEHDSGAERQDSFPISGYYTVNGNKIAVKSRIQMGNYLFDANFDLTTDTSSNNSTCLENNSTTTNGSDIVAGSDTAD